MWSVIVPLAAFPCWMVMQSEPVPVRRWVHIGGFLLVFAVLTAAAVVVGWVSSRRWSAVVVPLVFLVSGVSTVGAESLHWRWSRDTFSRVARGEELPCPVGDDPSRALSRQDPCGAIGWWRVTGVTEHDGTVVMWLGLHDCYAGNGLARPADPETGAEGVRAALEAKDISAMIIVTPWRGGWYDVCLLT